jgi:hypothetical protein
LEEVDTPFASSNSEDCEKPGDDWPGIEVCEFGPMATWVRD